MAEDAGDTTPDLARRAAAEDDRPALIVDGEPVLTVAEWMRLSTALAAGLVRRGVRRGDRVGLVFGDGDWADYAVATLGVHLAGAAGVAMSERLPAAERRRRIAACDIRGVLTGERAGAEPAAGWTSTVALTSRAGPPARLPAVRPGDLAEILYTSGTTGEPKPVAVTHGNLTYGQGRVRGQLFGAVDGILAGVPAATNAGHSALMVALGSGTPVHVPTRLDAGAVAAAVAASGAAAAILPPAVAARLARDGLAERHDLGRLRFVMLGSTGVPPAVLAALARALPEAGQVVGYGSTEAAPAFANRPLPPWSAHRDAGLFEGPRAGSVGTPRPGCEVSIAGPAGEPAPTGEVGQIRLRCPAPARAYHGDPAATARTFRDGWTWMGDLGRLDEDGQLHVVDRMADAVVRDGHVVSTLDVENALYWHPDVLEAAAFGIPGPDGPLVAVAAVLRRPVPERELRSVLADRLPEPDRPDRLDIVGELPHGILGKVLKRELRSRWAAAGSLR
ncbi:class I adenylate-forming enzyme family protein [Paractinoplanes atraurantiacus]|uniref:Acyl-CoA synthetase (AMP-forming)/AMP-acid ligase II n=1 Tax=Paractinoplanes atraurantiacus TaxID=1036182 RepID=A0A285GLM8_9ACTN|nr:class I adenylate-forming enzyme family protein [Actinoplanes atraurantiacus]SNY24477.1 Acyl-CoA synthetase (AMP-forming)/AMP-acid ligase II [Actinoplanes atraurantiacus]